MLFLKRNQQNVTPASLYTEYMLPFRLEHQVYTVKISFYYTFINTGFVLMKQRECWEIVESTFTQLLYIPFRLEYFYFTLQNTSTALY